MVIITWALHCNALSMTIDEEMKIKFHLNGNIEWHYVQLESNSIKSNQIELDSDSIELNSNSTIGLRFNWIKHKLMEKISKIYYEYDVKKKTFKNTETWNDMLPCLFPLEWTKQISIWNWSSDDHYLRNLKLSSLNQLQWILVTRIIIVSKTLHHEVIW